MEWMWVGQSILLLMIVLLTLTMWRLYVRLSRSPSDDRVAAGLNILEARIQQWDTESRERHDKMDQHLRALQRICEKAKGILDKSKWEGEMQPTSLEEAELKSLVKDVTIAEELQSIPTLQQVEETKKRLKQEMALDLRSLLREQLA